MFFSLQSSTWGPQLHTSTSHTPICVPELAILFHKLIQFCKFDEDASSPSAKVTYKHLNGMDGILFVTVHLHGHFLAAFFWPVTAYNRHACIYV